MNMHLTLMFLGEVEDSRIEWVKERLLAAVSGIAPFTFRLDGKGLFSKRDGGILWAGAARAPELEHLAAQVRARLNEFDDNKPFKSHITVGRAKRRIDEHAYQNVEWVPVDYPVRGIELIRSVLYPEGPVYHRVAEIPLRG
jgi:2'-5' RNA ligase